MNGVALTSGAGKQKRSKSDFYPTPPAVTHALMQFLDLPAGRRILEPACGDGAMSRVIEEYGHEVTSSDIRQTGYGAAAINFLTARLDRFDAVITNPPFVHSVGFIEKALTVAPIVAMVLKSQYWHAQERTALFEKYPPAYILPLTWRPDFAAGRLGDSPLMEVFWTVWIEGQTEARYRPLRKPVSTPAQGVLPLEPIA